MATREPSPTATMHKMHTDVAVLQTHMNHLDERMQEVRNDVKHLETKIEQNHAATSTLFKEMKDENASSHKELTDKISALEKWKWMLMGGCAAVGALATELVKLL